MASISETEPPNDDNSSIPLEFNANRLHPKEDSLPQSIPKPFENVDMPTEATLSPVAEVSTPQNGTPSRIADATRSGSSPFGPSPESLVRASPKMDIETVEAKSKPEVESEKEQEEILRFLRYKLQKGLLPTTGGPIPEEMKVMSLYLKKLESSENPSPRVLHATRILKLLKGIKKIDQIPRDDEFSFKGRVTYLLDKWEVSLDKDDPTTISTRQPIDNHAITNENQLTYVDDTQQALKNHTEVSAAGSIGESRGNMSVESEPSTRTQEAENNVTPTNQQFSATPPPTLTVLKAEGKYLVIDLTGDDEVNTDNKSGVPEPGKSPAIGPSEAKSAQVGRSPLPSGKYCEPSPTDVHTSPKPGSAKSHDKKRKRLDITEDGQSLESIPDSLSSTQMNCETPKRQQPRRKTSPKQHLTNEIQWMNGAVRKIEKTIEGVEQEIDAIRKKKIWLLETTRRLFKEHNTEMKSAKRRKIESTELKGYLLAWGAQDEKVTDEWSRSGGDQ